ncbi:hypothetical protein EC973_002462 [Apophysomyces ossiformis]|uniref:RRM domain-containing protein n=1 Tax=Apophysomyces ossiformis TaxID=679940 RepID=A0A8H7EMW1_9FUNG|nr:hypothetical protein EC973_002462 [Apophysomyces ossiformis]
MTAVGSLPSVSPMTNGLYSVLLQNGNSVSHSAQVSSFSTNNIFTSNNGEEISTIFVVGFPEDMQEREFQNMFIFSPGFEAATLKVPNKDTEDDPSARKQIIGFAKFRTRLEAMEAKDILSGRKVDAEKGSVLKAEMAKKNLHTKRGLSNDQIPQVIPAHTKSYPILSQQQQQQQQQQQKRYTLPPPTSQAAAYEAFHSVPAFSADLLPPNELYADLFSPNATPTTPFSESAFISRASQQLDMRSGSVGDIFNGSGIGNGLMASTSARTPAGFNPDHRYSSPHILENDPNINSLSKSTPLHTDRRPSSLMNSSIFSQANPNHHYPHQQHPPSPPPQSHAQDNPNLGSRFGGLSINTSTTTISTGGLPSPGITSPTGYQSFGILGSANPADQNPPCNTLYVGNLPPNTNEEELKALFSKCVGYKRLSFRVKPSGPICFVEFDDVNCAAQALQELYGNPLSNSTKGGIRLSFSKNPLGVRQNSINGCTSPSLPGTGVFAFLGPLGARRESLPFDPQLS